MNLQYKITLSIFVILLVIGVAGATVMVHLQRQTAAARFKESAVSLVHMVHGTLEHDMLEGGQANIQDAIGRIASGTLINKVVILSNTQRVYASGDSSEIGQTRNDETIARALASGEVMASTEKQHGRDELRVVMPVVNKPACQGCHGAETRVIGAIAVSLNRRPIDDQIKSQLMIMAWIGGLTFLGVGAAMAFLIRSGVVNPLSRLAASARRLAQGDFSARTDVTRKDEVGMLARTFNQMAEQVEQYALALEDSKRDLEKRVQERTREVQQMAAVRGQLLNRLISAQEEERRRVARELHDEAGQSLTMIMTDLARAVDTLPDSAVEAREKLSRSRSLAAQTLAELRKLIYDLRPEVLDQLGLVPALRSYVRSRLESENIEVRLNFSGMNEPVSPQVEITLFRVIQEAITNIVRHAGASRVNIQLSARDAVVTAIIEDNGRGFDVEAAFQSPESWGLRGIRERAAVVGGRLNMESKVGKGTRIKLQIPLDGV